MQCVDGCMFLTENNTVCTFYGIGLSMVKGQPTRCKDCLQDESDYKADQLIKSAVEVVDESV